MTTSRRFTRLVALGCALAAFPAFADEAVFATPEAALEALRDAIVNEDTDALRRIFGPENEADIIGGDPAAIRQTLDDAQEAVAAGIRLVPGEDDDSRIVLIGLRDWPLPFPIVRGDKGWSYDIEEGLEEIVDRRIGENELTAIANARAYVDAQLLYATVDHDADKVLEYAQKLISSENGRDGLYWPDPDGTDPSPLGPLAASEADYLRYVEAGEALHGYNYRILTAQGPNPPGKDYDYVINGNMIAGFALVAWPEAYGNSGIMTFVISHQGELFEKDLGPDTEAVVGALERYDPDASWTLVPDDDGTQ
ncbi:MAG: DUF2950 domain-containing protein [Geminicoccaceae bacterium]